MERIEMKEKVKFKQKSHLAYNKYNNISYNKSKIFKVM